MWNISFTTIGPEMTKKQIDTVNDYFITMRKFAALKPVSIPSSYFTKGCVFNITLYAKFQFLVSDIASIIIRVTIVEDIPKIKFASKSQAVQKYPGDQKNTITMQIANAVCKKNAAENYSAELIPIRTNFELFNGYDTKSMIKGGMEKKLERTITEEYNNNHMLSIDRRSGLKYGRYYKLVATITNTKKGITNSDTLYFTFTKPAITSVIDGVGSVTSISYDITLSSTNSSLPESSEDFIERKWSCISCTGLSKSSPCSCPTIKRSDSYLPTLSIPKGTLKTLSKYIYSLTITATDNNGVKRSSIAQAEFITYTGVFSPLTGYSYAGNSNTVKDLYFSFRMFYNGDDSILKFDWTLTEIASLNPKSNISYSEKNGYTNNYFKLLGVDIADSIGSDDAPIPAGRKPTYITPTKQRIVGVDQNTLTPLLKYTFGVKVTYPENPSFSFISFIAPKLPRTRILSITPSTGIGFSTPFSILFLLPAITDLDQARYQVLRRDCPGQNNTKKPLTQELGQSNIYTTTLAPGSASCDFQVEITVRAFEYDDHIDQTCIVTVSAPAKTATDTVAEQLDALLANKDSMTVDQKITALNSISSVNLTEPSASTKKSIQTMLDLISELDAPKGTVMNLTDNSMKPQLLKNLAGIMGNIVNNQANCVDLKTASLMAAKIKDYMNICTHLTGGSSIIPICVDTLSGIAKIGKNLKANSTYFDQIQQTLNTMSDIKAKEVQPGAPPYSLTSDTIDLLSKKNYLNDFDSPQNTTTGSGNSMNLPGGLADQLKKKLKKWLM